MWIRSIFPNDVPSVIFGIMNNKKKKKNVIFRFFLKAFLHFRTKLNETYSVRVPCRPLDKQRHQMLILNLWIIVKLIFFIRVLTICYNY